MAVKITRRNKKVTTNLILKVALGAHPNEDESHWDDAHNDCDVEFEEIAGGEEDGLINGRDVWELFGEVSDKEFDMHGQEEDVDSDDEEGGVSGAV
eukprot:gene37469-46222_t